MVTPPERTLSLVKEVAFGLLAILLVFLALFSPRAALVEGEERFDVAWEDGTASSLSFAELAPFIEGVEDGKIVLGGEKKGTVPASEECRAAERVLRGGSLAELLEFSFRPTSRLEKLALFVSFGSVGYYAGEFFAFDGEKFGRTAREGFPEVVLLSGKIGPDVLKFASARSLFLRSEAELDGEALVGTDVLSVAAELPYFVRDGGIYLSTAGGVRLVAALPGLKKLVASCDFIDDDALAACASLEELVLPDSYEGTLYGLFGPDGLGRSRVPASLKSVTGGNVFELS